MKTATIERDISFAEWMVSKRKEFGISQASLAKQLGVSQVSVCFWETGRNLPRQNRQLWQNIANIFQVHINDIPHF